MALRIICPECGDRQWSLYDQAYLQMSQIRFPGKPQCWSCDRHEWEDGSLPLDDFEQREEFAHAQVRDG